MRKRRKKTKVVEEVTPKSEYLREDAAEAVKQSRLSFKRYNLALDAFEQGRIDDRRLEKFYQKALKDKKSAEKLVKKFRKQVKRENSSFRWFSKMMLAFDIIALICYFVFYGPFGFVRDTFVTTAVSTGNHKYFANVFYSQETIDEITAKNQIIESGDETDTSAIKFSDPTAVTSYSSIYEEQILKKNPDNDLYKVIEVEGSTWKGWVVAIYDASRISNVLSSKLNRGGQTITEIAKENDAIIAINASGFTRYDSGAVKPNGNYIVDGKIIYNSGSKAKMIGFNGDNVLMLINDTAENAIAKGMRSSVCFSPFLIVNGEPAKMSGDGGWGKRPRTAIGQRQDGIVLFFVIDGKTMGSGISMVDLQKLMIQYNCYNAANLDGGGSTSLAIDGKLINSPAGWDYTGERYIPDAWIVK